MEVLDRESIFCITLSVTESECSFGANNATCTKASPGLWEYFKKKTESGIKSRVDTKKGCFKKRLHQIGKQMINSRMGYLLSDNNEQATESGEENQHKEGASGKRLMQYCQSVLKKMVCR